MQVLHAPESSTAPVYIAICDVGIVSEGKGEMWVASKRTEGVQIQVNGMVIIVFFGTSGGESVSVESGDEG